MHGAWHVASCMGGVPVGGWGNCMCILPTLMWIRSGAGPGVGDGSGLSDGDVGLEVVGGVSSEMDNKFVFYLGVCLFRGVSI